MRDRGVCGSKTGGTAPRPIQHPLAAALVNSNRARPATRLPHFKVWLTNRRLIQPRFNSRFAFEATHRDDAGNRAFTARSRPDDIAPGAQLFGFQSVVVKSLIKAERLTFARKEHPVSSSIPHGQFDRAVTEQLCTRHIVDADAAVAALAWRRRPHVDRPARLHGHPAPRRAKAWYARPGRCAGGVARLPRLCHCRHRRAGHCRQPGTPTFSRR